MLASSVCLCVLCIFVFSLLIISIEVLFNLSFVWRRQKRPDVVVHAQPQCTKTVRSFLSFDQLRSSNASFHIIFNNFQCDYWISLLRMQFSALSFSLFWPVAGFFSCYFLLVDFILSIAGQSRPPTNYYTSDDVAERTLQQRSKRRSSKTKYESQTITNFE